MFSGPVSGGGSRGSRLTLILQRVEIDATDHKVESDGAMPLTVRKHHINVLHLLVAHLLVNSTCQDLSYTVSVQIPLQ